ncbi:MAG: helix-hairpin-helix protein [Flavisolibacter sp.]|jgi:competence ComEA-like helix-hairpin-helix protein|nr:helix-hairpin-helix protein [Flavisolibacter sp.]
MFWKKFIKDYFTFGKRDRIGAFVIVAVLVGSILVPKLFSNTGKPMALKEDSVLVKAIDTLQTRQLAAKKYSRDQNGYSDRNNNYQYESSQKAAFINGELFQFDPNTITAGDWQRLGLNEKTSKTIEKYVSKGGKFYKPEDLMKIWGMPEGFYERVKSYVAITSVAKNYPAYENKPFVREAKKMVVVNINEGDTSSFIALPGIGSKLSSRIIGFREKLGGFYSVDQIGETYGLPDSTFQMIKGQLQIDGTSIKKININTATKDELKVHPYIRWNLANAIVEYRNQHGAYKNLEELKNIVVVDEVTFGKLVHYLSL